MSAQDIEQYRPGFEAWVRQGGGEVYRYPDGEYYREIEDAWQGWVAAKLEGTVETK